MQLKRDEETSRKVSSMLQERDALLAKPPPNLHIISRELEEKVFMFLNVMLIVQVLALESQRDLTRCYVHVDMDAFYANVEMRDNPEFVLLISFS